jgi:chromosome partitioning protein
MRRIAVTNQKGGVGKTTTTVNMGAALARLGQRVLICDLDPQCNLTVHVDVDPAAEAPCLYDLLGGRATLAEVVRPTAEAGLEVAPAGVDLAGIELELATAVGREMILSEAFKADAEDRGQRWDFVLVDCPPSLGLLSLNALVACDEVFVPIQAEFFALQGLGKLWDVVRLVQQRLNPALAITGMVSCRHDPSTNLSKAVIANVREHFGDVFLKTIIRRNVKLAEAPSHGKTIFSYAPDSRGAEDYLALAQEILTGELPEDASPAKETATTADPGPDAPAATPEPPETAETEVAEESTPS